MASHPPPSPLVAANSLFAFGAEEGSLRYEHELIDNQRLAQPGKLLAVNLFSQLAQRPNGRINAGKAILRVFFRLFLGGAGHFRLALLRFMAQHRCAKKIQNFSRNAVRRREDLISQMLLQWKEHDDYRRLSLPGQSSLQDREPLWHVLRQRAPLPPALKRALLCRLFIEHKRYFLQEWREWNKLQDLHRFAHVRLAEPHIRWTADSMWIVPFNKRRTFVELVDKFNKRQKEQAQSNPTSKALQASKQFREDAQQQMQSTEESVLDRSCTTTCSIGSIGGGSLALRLPPKEDTARSPPPKVARRTVKQWLTALPIMPHSRRSVGNVPTTPAIRRPSRESGSAVVVAIKPNPPVGPRPPVPSRSGRSSYVVPAPLPPAAPPLSTRHSRRSTAV
eukprot:TRINITY_DN31158_c0_g1_i1.p1 TRINITY_DN31158_c0_g1~~TRINITY_DN31158_c0_g1_i1.p1  ORF type:complete len:401 (-),score=32.77 TRINITY_DN31158_c0_g1_i1:356-1531(-)